MVFVNKGIQIYLWVPGFNSSIVKWIEISIFWVNIPRSEMTGFCCDSNFIFLKELSLWLHCLTFPLTIHKGFIFFTPSPTLLKAFHHIHRGKVGWRRCSRWEKEDVDFENHRGTVWGPRENILGCPHSTQPFPRPRVCLLGVVRGLAVRIGTYQLSIPPFDWNYRLNPPAVPVILNWRCYYMPFTQMHSCVHVHIYTHLHTISSWCLEKFRAIVK